MANILEKTMPEFWKKVGTKAFEVTGAISITYFIAVNSEINGLRAQITDLNRYSMQLVQQEDRARRDQQVVADLQTLEPLIEKNKNEWRTTVERMELRIESLRDERERSLRSIEDAIGDLRIRLATLESQPAPEKPRPKTPAPNGDTPRP